MTPEASKQAVRDFLRSRGKGLSIRPEYVAQGLGWKLQAAKDALEALKAEPPKTGPEPLPKPELKEEREYRDNKLIVSVHGVPYNDPESLIDHLKLDRGIWQLDRFKFKMYQGYAAQKAQSKVMKRPARKGGGEYIAWERPEKTQIIVQDLYSVDATFVRKVAVITAREEIQGMLADMKRAAPVYPSIRPAAAPSGNLLELSLPDAHLGKLAWGEETGWENFDSKIADAEFRDAFSALLRRTGHYKFDRVLLVPGNDLLNVNGTNNMTVNGTPQSCDGRQQKMFRLAAKATIWTIERALDIADRVDVLPVPGNHDREPIFYLSEVLSAWFHKCERVHIDESPTLRKFYQWGNVGLMFTHGEGGKAKRDKLPMLMATERRKMWGNAKFCEIHTGDKHQVRLEEEFGVRVRILPSLCPPDAWHSGEGYVGNIRSAEAYIWNKEEGLIGTAVYAIPNQGPRQSEAA